MQYEVEVLASQRIMDATNGKPIYQVILGEPHPVTDEIRDRLSEEQQNLTEVYANTISIWVPIEKGPQYPMGSKWTVYLDDNGDIRIKSKKDNR